MLNLSKPLPELDATEIIKFAKTNDTWDAIILSNFDIEETFPVKDYNHMHKLPKSSPFPTNKVLLVSRRILSKLESVNVPFNLYVCDKTIFTSYDITEQTDRYVVNQIVKLFIKDNKLQYAWKPI